MISVSDFSRLVSAIYAAALLPSRWDDTMGEIQHAFDSTADRDVRSTSLVHADGVSRSMTGTLAPEADTAYADHFGPMDYVLRSVERGPVGVVRTGQELIPAGADSEFYNEWVRPFDIEDGVFVRLTDEVVPKSFLVAGSNRRGVFSSPERVGLAAELVPHLRQALDTQLHLNEIHRRNGHLEHAFDLVDHGVVILGADSLILHTNAMADAVLRAGDGLTVERQRLAARWTSDDGDLQRGVAAAVGGRDDGVHSGRSMKCRRVPGGAPYVVHLLPLDRSLAGPMDRHAAAVALIVDTARETLPSRDLLRELYGLTRSEVDVALRVLRGEGLKPIAEELSLSLPTVRTHLRHIFDKTGTHRQAELVRLLLTIQP